MNFAIKPHEIFKKTTLYNNNNNTLLNDIDLNLEKINIYQLLDNKELKNNDFKVIDDNIYKYFLDFNKNIPKVLYNNNTKKRRRNRTNKNKKVKTAKNKLQYKRT